MHEVVTVVLEAGELVGHLLRSQPRVEPLLADGLPAVGRLVQHLPQLLCVDRRCILQYRTQTKEP